MRSGILGGTRACLCKNGTYDVKCCDGGLWAQGIGNITKEIIPESAGKYKITHCDTGHHHNIHIHDTTLILNNVYFFYFENTHHNGFAVRLEKIMIIMRAEKEKERQEKVNERKDGKLANANANVKEP